MLDYSFISLGRLNNSCLEDLAASGASVQTKVLIAPGYGIQQIRIIVITIADKNGRQK